MLEARSSGVVVLVALTIVVAPVAETQAGSRDALGVRAGMSNAPDQFVIGGQAELGPVLGPALFAPSLDIGFGAGQTVAVLNLDLRWYLLPLPETGLYFYGAAGPALLVSPDTDVGFSAVGGIDIPMTSARNRYNFEARFGFGDVPDRKIVLSVLFVL